MVHLKQAHCWASFVQMEAWQLGVLIHLEEKEMAFQEKYLAKLVHQLIALYGKEQHKTKE